MVPIQKGKHLMVNILKYMPQKAKKRASASEKFMIYTGPSMNPTLKAGDRLSVISYNGRQIRRGDVVVFLSPENSQQITHRVISVNSQGIRTRGDNNIHIDSSVLKPKDILGRVVCAQRRNKLIRIYGGKKGQYYALTIRAIHRIDSAIYLLLRPIYHKLAESGVFRRLAFIQKKMRVLSFERPSGTEHQLLIGKHVIGRLLPEKEHWQIRRPFRFFVDEESLPIGNSLCSKIHESEGSQSKKKTVEKNRENSALTEKIRNMHAELTLCGKSRNALLHLPDDFLTYILSTLRNESSKPPKATIHEWSEVLSLLKPHWIIPLLYRQIGALPPELRPTEDVLQKMRKSFLVSRVRCFHMEKQLSKIIKAFHDGGVRPLVLKGPTLALSVYPDPAMRPNSDLDLLVLPQQMLKARDILEQQDYKCLGKRFENCKDFYSEETFVPQRDKRENRVIELHWDLHSLSGISREAKLEDLFQRAVKIEKSGLTFETLNPVDALIHRAINMAIWHNRDIRLIWIYDTALLAQHLRSPEDWEVLQKRSIDWRARLALEYSLKMAQIWVGLKMPERFDDFTRWPRPSETEADAWSDAMLRHDRITSFLKIHWSNSSGVLKKIRYLFHLLFPSPKIIRLDYPPSQNWLLPLSYIRRLFRWFKQYFVNRIGLS
jgi:signal peptidase I